MTLKSRARDVRDTARDVLCKIALSLGSKYFLFIIQELKSSLTRGYQVHNIYIYTLERTTHVHTDLRTQVHLRPFARSLNDVIHYLKVIQLVDFVWNLPGG